jgi:hypothetical protein
MSANHPIKPSSPSEFRSDYVPLEKEDEQLLERSVLRLSGNILGLVLGIVSSLLIFGRTQP